MPQFKLSSEIKFKLAKWANREKDYLMSIKSMAESTLICPGSKTTVCIDNDFDFAVRLRQAFTSSSESFYLSDDDFTTFIEAIKSNKAPQFQAFWDDVLKALQNVQPSSPSPDSV